MKKLFSNRILLTATFALALPFALNAAPYGPSPAAKEVPLDVKIEKTNGGETTLQELAKDKKALVIDFWATYCGPCKKALPGLKQKAAKLAPHGVEVIAINLDNKKGAEKFRQDLGAEFPWLSEFANPVYSQQLKINSVPRMVVLSSTGQVLYNGHPSDESAINKALEQAGVKM